MNARTRRDRARARARAVAYRSGYDNGHRDGTASTDAMAARQASKVAEAALVLIDALRGRVI